MVESTRVRKLFGHGKVNFTRSQEAPKLDVWPWRSLSTSGGIVSTTTTTRKTWHERTNRRTAASNIGGFGKLPLNVRGKIAPTTVKLNCKAEVLLEFHMLCAHPAFLCPFPAPQNSWHPRVSPIGVLTVTHGVVWNVPVLFCILAVGANAAKPWKTTYLRYNNSRLIPPPWRTSCGKPPNVTHCCRKYLLVWWEKRTLQQPPRHKHNIRSWDDGAMSGRRRQVVVVGDYCIQKNLRRSGVFEPDLYLTTCGVDNPKSFLGFEAQFGGVFVFLVAPQQAEGETRRRRRRVRSMRVTNIEKRKIDTTRYYTTYIGFYHCKWQTGKHHFVFKTLEHKNKFSHNTAQNSRWTTRRHILKNTHIQLRKSKEAFFAATVFMNQRIC